MRVHLGQSGRVAVEIADRGLGIARQQALVIALRIGLGVEIGARALDHLVGIRHPDGAVGLEVRGDVRQE